MRFDSAVVTRGVNSGFKTTDLLVETRRFGSYPVI